MKEPFPFHSPGVAGLRPWPSGPPLRGWAPHRNAGGAQADNWRLVGSQSSSKPMAPIGAMEQYQKSNL